MSAIFCKQCCLTCSNRIISLKLLSLTIHKVHGRQTDLTHLSAADCDQFLQQHQRLEDVSEDPPIVETSEDHFHDF